MYLGTRKIRSAGRTSGSIEITLPSELQVLLGVSCQLTVRNGTRPEIVLQPDLTGAHVLFQTLWDCLRLGLMDINEIGEFALVDFTLTLFPPSHWQDHPPLVYAEGLIVARARHNGSAQTGRSLEAATHCLASLATVSAGRLGLTGVLALAFGDAVPYCLFGIAAGLSTEFELGMAHRAFWNGQTRAVQTGSPFDTEIWLKAQPGFQRVYEQFRIWQAHPDRYDDARDKWHRALSMEIGMQLTS